MARLAVTHPERLITAILGGHSGYRDWEVEDEKRYEDRRAKLVVIEGATHGGERAAVRYPEFRAAVREFIAAHR